ncbi:MAG: ABC transporter ATP-binding protein [Hungatella sp.]|nr:ABC transporter ATP-binding protein [Hungatella sp.]
MKEILKVKTLKKYYGNKKGNIVKAIDDISFSINKGEFVGIMGSSGSGKTTLLNIIATIDNPDSGNVFFNNVDILQLSEKELAFFRGEKIGYVFQDYNLINTLTVFENISLSLIMLNRSVLDIKELIEETAQKFGIFDLLDKYPYEISGGQRQRCACARAIIKEPTIVLADEPTGALDTISSKELMDTLGGMNTKLNSTILLVTHDAITASYCQKVLFLKDGKIFNTILKGDKSKKDFYIEILDVLSILGDEFNDMR